VKIEKPVSGVLYSQISKIKSKFSSLSIVIVPSDVFEAIKVLGESQQFKSLEDLHKPLSELKGTSRFGLVDDFQTDKKF